MKQLCRPRNWDEFQHYKDRRPPWIKLHRALLDDREYQRLPVASRALAPMLWLLASESEDGSFDASIEELTFRLRQPTKDIEAGLKPLIDAGFFTLEHVASSALAECLHVAVPEESRGEPKAEAEARSEINSSPAKLPTCPRKVVIDLYHEVLPEMPSVRLMDNGRNGALSDFWKFVLTSRKQTGEPRAQTGEQALDWIRSYFETARHNDFLMGRTPRSGTHKNWKCDLDFLLSERGRKHVIEKTEESA